MSKWPEDFLYTADQSPHSSSTSLLVKPVFDTRSITPDGRIKTSLHSVIQEKSFRYGTNGDNVFEHSSSLGGTLSHISGAASSKLEATSAGAFSGLRARTYSYYLIGQVNKWKSALSVSGSGVARWGIFDESDGYFFEYSGSIRNIVRRSSSTGLPEECRIPQQEWNVDKLDGHGVSELSHSFDRHAMYAITWQWYGAGVARFFIGDCLVHVIDSRVTSNDKPNISHGDLPACFEVEGPNTSMKLIGTSTRIESDGLTKAKVAEPISVICREQTANTTETHLISVRPKQYLGESNNILNRSMIVPKDLSLYSVDNAAIVRVYAGTTEPVSGSGWSQAAYGSVCEVLFTGSFNTSGSRNIFTSIIPMGDIKSFHDDYHDIFSFNQENFTRLPYSTDRSIIYTITVESLKAPNTEVTVTTRWFEFS